MTNEEGKHDGLRHMSAGMRRWAGLLAAGYSIRPVIRGSSYRGTVWRPGLFNADGGFVQCVRWDTLRKLVGLGLVGEITNYELGITNEEKGSAAGMDVKDGANSAGGWVDRDSGQPGAVVVPVGCGAVVVGGEAEGGGGGVG